jgi:hypothetical protein
MTVSYSILKYSPIQILLRYLLAAATADRSLEETWDTPDADDTAALAASA